MTTFETASRNAFRWGKPPLTGVAAGAALAALLKVSFDWPNRAERRLCDQAVEALLHSKEPVEVQLAGIIVRELNCSIGRRLGSESPGKASD